MRLVLKPNHFSLAIRLMLWGLSLFWMGMAGMPHAVAEEIETPEIVAQGFNMAVLQDGLVGKFDRLRVRVEAPGRIEKLYIRERSYEVDLAETLDRNNYQLFAIPKRVRRYKDVTLDFRNYINEKIEKPGRYEFFIEVTDEDGKTATAHLALQINAQRSEKPPKSDADVVPIASGSFWFERNGAGPVKGGEEFGITWRTTNEVAVDIRLDPNSAAYSIAAGPTAEQFDEISLTSDIQRQRQQFPRVGAIAPIEFPTAHNAASGRVLAIESPQRFCILKVNRSETSISAIGTTVILHGDYKCAGTLATSSLEKRTSHNL